MSIIFNKLSRRQFLVGSGELALALPLLPSLLTSTANAQVNLVPQRIAFFNFGHCLPESKWINPSVATRDVGVDGAKDAVLSALNPGSWGSPISASLSNPIFERLRAKGHISVVRGIDNMIHSGHGAQYLSGSSQRVDQWNPLPFPSIDTVFESSATLYPSSTPSNVKKVIRLDHGDIESSYKKVGGQIVPVPGYAGPVQIFKDLFSNLGGAPASEVDSSIKLKKSILNRVHMSYLSAKSSRRISSDDKNRLEEHMSLISDLEKKNSSSALVSTTVSCVKPAAPTSDGNYQEINTLSLQLMALAVKCGLSKVFVTDFEGHIGSGISGLPKNVSFHNGIIHNNEGQNYSEAQINDYYMVWMKWHFDLIATNFLSSLDVEEGTSGRTYLDNMLSAVLTEGGVDTSPGNHTCFDFQPILFGTMGGYLKGDRYTVLPTKTEQVYQHIYKYRVPYNSLLITFLEAMKIPKSEYTVLTNGKGYGIYKAGQFGEVEMPEYTKYFGHRFYSPISEILKT